MQSQMIGLQTSFDRIFAAVMQSGALAVMRPGLPIDLQTIREGLVPLPRLRMNMRKLFPDRLSTPLSKHCKGLRMRQRTLRLPPPFLHRVWRDIAVSCEQILTSPKGQESKVN
jgi:hypothetical protein